MTSPHYAGRWLAAISAAAIAVVTLRPLPEQAELVAKYPFWCLGCGELGAVDVLLNLLLFVPVGVGLYAGGLSLPRATAACAALSLGIELLQYAVPGRDPSAGDLLTNTLGGWLGALFASRWRRFVFPSANAAVALGVGAAALWLVQTALTAAALRPALTDAPYWGQHAPELGQFEHFEGTVTSAAVGSVRLPSGRLENTGQVRSLLERGQPLLATARPAGPTAGLAPIVSIFDGQQREIALVGQWGTDLVFRIRTLAVDMRLRPAAVRLADAFALLDTGVVEVAGHLGRGPLSLAVSISSNPRERILPMNAQWGWSLLLPFEYAHGAASGALTAVWLTAWMLPIGWWAGLAERPGPMILAVLGLVTIGLVAVPLAAGLRVVSPAEALWAAGSLAAGWWSAAALRQTSTSAKAP